MIPATAALALFLFGIDELATQMEEPFTILPMQGFCDKIYNWCMDIVSWEPGDNGMHLNTPLPQHTVGVVGGSVTVAAAAKEPAHRTPVPAAAAGRDEFNEPVTVSTNGTIGETKRTGIRSFLKI
jgi:hypothetical protein